MEKNNQFLGHAACLGAYIIFGLNIILCKDIALSKEIPPIALFVFRAAGATALFWILSMFLPKEKMSQKDLCLTFLASMLGLFLTQISFLKAITMTTSIDASIMSSLNPVMTMFVAAIFIHEPITVKKAGGVAVSLCGVLLLIFNSIHINSGADHTTPLGLLLMFCNGLAFALYLGIFKPLISKYSVVTFMKWMFLFSLVASLPLGLKPVMEINYGVIEPKVYLEIGYVVLFATFIAYFLIPVGQKRLRPTIVSLYNYVQPIIAMVVSVIIGIDRLTWIKVLATILVFTGVALVNRSRAAGQN
ncbi:MAG: DMT family transporter [Bacteroidales bacterium]|nr:DMT family transporter [Bacteroidales bacterium]